MPRKPAKERNPIRGGRPPRDYEIGDEVFFSFAGTAGEGLFIGQLRVDPAILLLAQPPCIEVPASCRSPTGHINPQLGHSTAGAWRACPLALGASHAYGPELHTAMNRSLRG